MKKGHKFHFLSTAFNVKWQLFLSSCLTALFVLYNIEDILLNSISTNTGNLLVCFALLGSILTLVTTLSVGFLMNYSQSNNTEKIDIFYKIKDRICELENLIYSHSEQSLLTKETFKLTETIKSKNIDEFPINDWEDLVSPVTTLISPKEFKSKDSSSIEHQILSYLSMLEQLLDQFSLIFIQRVVLDMQSQRVIKGFFYLAGLLINSLVIFYLHNTVIIDFLYFSPIFFGTLITFHLIEIGWLLFQESKENPKVIA